MPTARSAPHDDLDTSSVARAAHDDRNLVVHFERNSYLVTPGPTTNHLAGRSRKVTMLKWPDGRLAIEYEGQRLPYKLCDEYPFVAPGEVVEREARGRDDGAESKLPSRTPPACARRQLASPCGKRRSCP